MVHKTLALVDKVAGQDTVVLVVDKADRIAGQDMVVLVVDKAALKRMVTALVDKVVSLDKTAVLMDTSAQDIFSLMDRMVVVHMDHPALRDLASYDVRLYIPLNQPNFIIRAGEYDQSFSRLLSFISTSPNIQRNYTIALLSESVLYLFVLIRNV